MPDANGLALRGINYDTGTNYAGGSLSRARPTAEDLRHDMQAIRHSLHCNSVNVFGTDPDRLAEAADAAVAAGLHAWLQPRLVEADHEALVDYVAGAAGAAEQLRQQHGGSRIALNIGCELTVFSPGIIPGEHHGARAEALLSPQMWARFGEFSARLDTLLTRLRRAAAERFGGQITYGAGLWEDVDWRDFDVIGLNYYRTTYNEADYAANLRSFQRYGKPVVIVEFGCCTFRGAGAMGPAGGGIVDWSAVPPRLTGAYVRDEQEQADHLSELLTIFTAEGVHGAYVFEFAEPARPVSDDPRHDLDMSSFGIVKVTGEGWRPKAAFHRLGELYRALPSTPTDGG